MLARPGATNVKIAAPGEIDDQLYIRRHFMYSVWARELWKIGYKSGNNLFIKSIEYI